MPAAAPEPAPPPPSPSPSGATTGMTWDRKLMWIILMALLLSILGACATVVGFLLVQPDRAAAGRETPEEAVRAYVGALAIGDRAVHRLVHKERRDDLGRQSDRYRAEMRRSPTGPQTVDVRERDVSVRQDGDRATAVAVVTGMRRRPEDGRPVPAGAAHPWRFELRRDDDRWLVWSVQPHPWCGGHVAAGACR